MPTHRWLQLRHVFRNTLLAVNCRHYSRYLIRSHLPVQTLVQINGLRTASALSVSSRLIRLKEDLDSQAKIPVNGDSPDGSQGAPGSGSKGDNGQKPKGNARRTQQAATSSVSTLEIPEEFPIVPVVAISRHPLFPKFIKVIEVSDPDLQNLILRRVHFHQPYIGLFMRKDDAPDSEVVNNVDDVYDVGSFCFIHEIEEIGNRLKMVVASIRRIKLVNPVHISDAEESEQKDEKLPPISDDNKTIMVNTCNLTTEPYEMSDEIKALGAEIILAAREIMSRNPLYRDIFQVSAIRGQVFTDNPDHLGDLGAVLSTADSKDLQEVMSEMNIKKRLMLSLNLLKKEVEIMRLQQKISEEVEEKIKVHNRKFLLQEQMKIIKRELGIEKDDKTSITEKLRSRLQGVAVPAHVQEVIDDEFNKLGFLDPQSAEFNVTRSYLDWLTILPWSHSTEESLDLERAKTILDEDHYGMDDVKNRILEFIAVSKLRGTTQGKILCFVGPPGVGKTSIARSIARALNREYFRFSVGGLSDVAEIKGHRRTYVGAMPGKIIQCLKKVKTNNPLVLIDEIDKIGRAAYHGDPSSALLEMLDPEQNSSFLDHYLDVTVDLSKVLFVCTANIVDTIPDALRDRMEIIQLSGYVAEEKLAIAKNYLIPNAAKDAGISVQHVSFSDNAINALNKHYCRESGVRGLQKNIEKVYRKVAIELVKEGGAEKKEIVIEAEDLEKYLGKPKFSSTRMYEVTPPGVVTGLAWTPSGGSTLFIETALIPRGSDDKSHDFVLTGNMGDVMKESASIALTYAKSFLAETFPNNDILTTSKVHLHVPEGATPKDGPSAGCTIVSALLSLALNTPVRHKLAMTGEVSLKGKILPVGGIKEKVIAAKRSGIKMLIMPSENRKDYDELPSFVKEGLEVHFVDHYADIFKLVFW